MIECIVDYYLKSAKGREVALQRVARFVVVPYIGSHVNFGGGVLKVTEVDFYEGGRPRLLIFEDLTMMNEAEFDETIEMNKHEDFGWRVISDSKQKACDAAKI